MQGRIQDFGKGGGLINILYSQLGEGTGGGVPPVTARGSGEALIVGSGAQPQPLFLLLRLFSMKFTVISNIYTSRDIRITRACMNSDERTVHSSQITMLWFLLLSN